jgi:hypothetical protein
MNSRILFLAGALACAGLQAVLYGLAGATGVAILAVLIGLLWTLPDLFPGERKLAWLRQTWLSNLWFILLGLASIGILWIQRPWPVAVLVLILSLAAWDLHAFRQRVYPAERVGGATVLRAYHSGRSVVHGQAVEGEEQAAFERAHLRALGLVILLCAVLSLGLYFLAGLIAIPAGLLVGLGLTLAMVLSLIFLARLALR